MSSLRGQQQPRASRLLAIREQLSTGAPRPSSASSSPNGGTQRQPATSQSTTSGLEPGCTTTKGRVLGRKAVGYSGVERNNGGGTTNGQRNAPRQTTTDSKLKSEGLGGRSGNSHTTPSSEGHAILNEVKDQLQTEQRSAGDSGQQKADSAGSTAALKSKTADGLTLIEADIVVLNDKQLTGVNQHPNGGFSKAASTSSKTQTKSTSSTSLLARSQSFFARLRVGRRNNEDVDGTSKKKKERKRSSSASSLRGCKLKTDCGIRDDCALTGRYGDVSGSVSERLCMQESTTTSNVVDRPGNGHAGGKNSQHHKAADAKEGDHVQLKGRRSPLAGHRAALTINELSSIVDVRSVLIDANDDARSTMSVSHGTDGRDGRADVVYQSVDNVDSTSKTASGDSESRVAGGDGGGQSTSSTSTASSDSVGTYSPRLAQMQRRGPADDGCSTQQHDVLSGSSGNITTTDVDVHRDGYQPCRLRRSQTCNDGPSSDGTRQQQQHQVTGFQSTRSAGCLPGRPPLPAYRQPAYVTHPDQLPLDRCRRLEMIEEVESPVTTDRDVLVPAAAAAVIGQAHVQSATTTSCVPGAANNSPPAKPPRLFYHESLKEPRSTTYGDSLSLDRNRQQTSAPCLHRLQATPGEYNGLSQTPSVAGSSECSGSSSAATEPGRTAISRQTTFLSYLARKFPTHARAICRSPDTSTASREFRKNSCRSPRGQTPGPTARQSEVAQPPQSPCDLPSSPACVSPCVGAPAVATMHGSGSCHNLRSTAPVVRSSNRTLESPLGHAFLVHRGETKRAVLPNEVTSIETVRALFVCSFPRCLCMSSFHNSTARKIYIQDRTSGVFYELDDLSEVKDRTVLKIHEGTELTDSLPGKSIQDTASWLDTNPPTDVTSRSTTPSCRLLENKSRGCPSTTSRQSSMSPMAYSNAQAKTNRARTLTDPCSSRSPAGVEGVHSYPSSSCTVTPDRMMSLSPNTLLSPVDTRRQCPVQVNICESVGSAASSTLDCETREFLYRVESQLTSLMSWLQSITGAQHQVSPPHGININNPVGSTAPVTASMTSRHGGAMLDIILALRRDTVRLRADHVTLRHQQLSCTEQMEAVIREAQRRINIVDAAVRRRVDVPGQRLTLVSCDLNVGLALEERRHEIERVERGLSDLEAVVDEIRVDAVSRRRNVSLTEVEALALVLSQLSRSLASLNDDYTGRVAGVKADVALRMQSVAADERLLKAEQRLYDESTRRYRKLMGTLTTLQKLAKVQSGRRPLVPVLRTKRDVNDEDRCSLMREIRAVRADQTARQRSLQAADAARIKRLRLTTNVALMRFTANLAAARNKLKRTENVALVNCRRRQAFQTTCRQFAEERRAACGASTINHGGPGTHDSASDALPCRFFPDFDAPREDTPTACFTASDFTSKQSSAAGIDVAITKSCYAVVNRTTSAGCCSQTSGQAGALPVCCMAVTTVTVCASAASITSLAPISTLSAGASLKSSPGDSSSAAAIAASFQTVLTHSPPPSPRGRGVTFNDVPTEIVVDVDANSEARTDRVPTKPPSGPLQLPRRLPTRSALVARPPTVSAGKSEVTSENGCNGHETETVKVSLPSSAITYTEGGSNVHISLPYDTASRTPRPAVQSDRLPVSTTSSDPTQPACSYKDAAAAAAAAASTSSKTSPPPTIKVAAVEPNMASRNLSTHAPHRKLNGLAKGKTIWKGKTICETSAGHRSGTTKISSLKIPPPVPARSSSTSRAGSRAAVAVHGINGDECKLKSFAGGYCSNNNGSRACLKELQQNAVSADVDCDCVQNGGQTGVTVVLLDIANGNKTCQKHQIPQQQQQQQQQLLMLPGSRREHGETQID